MRGLKEGVSGEVKERGKVARLQVRLKYEKIVSDLE